MNPACADFIEHPEYRDLLSTRNPACPDSSGISRGFIGHWKLYAAAMNRFQHTCVVIPNETVFAKCQRFHLTVQLLIFSELDINIAISPRVAHRILRPMKFQFVNISYIHKVATTMLMTNPILRQISTF